jgi:hypothetical protein
MRFLHYSAEPLTIVRSVAQEPNAKSGDKPDGLWFCAGSGDDGWKELCEIALYDLQRLRVVTEIVFKPTVNFMHVVGAEGIDAFTKKYDFVTKWAGGTVPRYDIDWFRIAQKFQGIIIAPYVLNRRFDAHDRWYTSWDCASGCVWDADAVLELKPMVPDPY